MLAFALFSAAAFAAFAAIEALRPRQTYPHAKAWRLRGAIALALYFAVGAVAPLAWDTALAENRMLDLRGLPFAAQLGIGFLVAETLGYAWHRTMHATPFLWRWFHQMHHSAERMDVWGAFYFSPLDMLGFTFMGSLALVGVAGVSGEAGLVLNVAILLLTMWQHLNIKTPHWLGYIVVRPESHALHHQRSVHRGNYCDVPLIDMLFGTYKNPHTITPDAGFYDGASLRIIDMLLGRDVSAPTADSRERLLPAE